MKKLTLFAAVAALAGSVIAGAPQNVEKSFKPSGDDDAVYVSWVFGAPRQVYFTVNTEDGDKHYRIRMTPDRRNLRNYVDYSGEAWLKANKKDYKPPERTPIQNACLKIFTEWNKKGSEYDLYPWFHDGRGLYNRKDIEPLIEEYAKTWANWGERKFEWVFRYNNEINAVELWLDGSFFGHIRDCGKIRSVDCKTLPPVKFDGGSRKVGSFKGDLPAIWPSRANDLLKKDAKLVFDKKGFEKMFNVWAPEDSVDTGKHHITTFNRDLGWCPLMLRSPYQTGPDYAIWGVPNLKYRYAYILCAEIPQEGRIPALGTHLTHYRNLSSGQIAYDRTVLTEDNVKTNSVSIRKVGELRYRDEKNKPAKSPLYLVRQTLDFGKIATVFENDPLLDFELVGNGTNYDKKMPRSSLQVFGVRLVETPYDFRIVENVRGNIFDQNDKPVTSVEIIANQDKVSGSLDYSIYDAHFKPMGKGSIPFSLAKRGDKQLLEVDLKQDVLGWFGLDYTFNDARGAEITRHEAAFTILGPDDREAGYESPYGAWPHAKGGHGNNPNRKETVEVMRKAGFHNTWPGHCPIDAESESEYPITGSMFHIGNSGKRSSAEVVKKRLDERVAEFKELQSRFPHIPMFQLLHEQGGRDIAEEMRFKPAVRGEYKGIEGDWEVYWCTEAAKRFRQEFPNIPIMIGNGSSSSEKVADLCRKGFDLDLVDYLGIESKGFQSIPEDAVNRESPGMLWTLRETAKRFGFNKKVSACAEYVFRPERRVTPKSGMWRYGWWNDYMWVTDFTLRDYLLSLAHGCLCISTGHIEDSVGTYYDTNWGAGGMCKAYPLSYPKRMFTALAVFTRVFDKASYSRRIPTDGNSTYALEFKRDRKSPDYATAFWTPHYGCQAKVFFPKGTAVTEWEVFGNSKSVPLASDGSVTIDFSGTPTYLTSSKPVEKVSVLRHYQNNITAKSKPIYKFNADKFNSKLTWWGNGDYRGVFRGIFTLNSAKDKVMGDYAEFVLDHDPKEPPMRWLGGKDWAPITNVPEVVQQFGCFSLKKPLELVPDGSYGIWVKGDSSGAPVMFQPVDADTGKRLQETLVCNLNFEGWHLIKYSPHARAQNKPVEGVKKMRITSVFIGSARVSLDPIEMAPITSSPGLGTVVEFDEKAQVASDDYYKAIMKSVNDKDL